MCLAPKIEVPQPDTSGLAAALAPNVQLPDANSGAVRVAGDEFRQRRRRARGFASNLLTGGLSGGLSAAAPIATKVLLGS